MYRATTLLLCVLTFSALVDSFPSPQDGSGTLGRFANRADQIIDNINKHVIDEEKNVYDFMNNISFKGLCNSKYCLISDHGDGPNIHKKITSQTSIDDGKLVTVNETTWTSDDGNRLSVYQVDIANKEVNPSDVANKVVNPSVAENKAVNPPAVEVKEVNPPAVKVKEVNPSVAENKEVYPTDIEVKEVNPPVVENKEVNPPAVEVKEVNPSVAENKEVYPSGIEIKAVNPPAVEVNPPAVEVKEVNPSVAENKEVYPTDIEIKEVNPPRNNDIRISSQAANSDLFPSGMKPAAPDNDLLTSTASPTTASSNGENVNNVNVAPWTNKDGRQYDVYRVYVPKSSGGECHNCPNNARRLEERLVDHLRNMRKMDNIQREHNTNPDVQKETIIKPTVSVATTPSVTQKTVARDEDKPLDLFHLLLGKSDTDFDRSKSSDESEK